LLGLTEHAGGSADFGHDGSRVSRVSRVRHDERSDGPKGRPPKCRSDGCGSPWVTMGHHLATQLFQKRRPNHWHKYA
jgi:hypothetical protein